MYEFLAPISIENPFLPNTNIFSNNIEPKFFFFILFHLIPPAVHTLSLLYHALTRSPPSLLVSVHHCLDSLFFGWSWSSVSDVFLSALRHGSPGDPAAERQGLGREDASLRTIDGRGRRPKVCCGES